MEGKSDQLILYSKSHLMDQLYDSRNKMYILTFVMEAFVITTVTHSAFVQYLSSAQDIEALESCKRGSAHRTSFSSSRK